MNWTQLGCHAPIQATLPRPPCVLRGNSFESQQVTPEIMNENQLTVLINRKKHLFIYLCKRSLVTTIQSSN